MAPRGKLTRNLGWSQLHAYGVLLSLCMAQESGVVKKEQFFPLGLWWGVNDKRHVKSIAQCLA